MPSDVRLRSAANAWRAQNGIRTGSSSPVEATWTQHCWSRSTFIVQVSMNVFTLIRFTRLAIASTGTASRWTSHRPSVLTKPDTPRSHTSQMSRRWSISSGRLISAVSDSSPVSASHRASSGASRLP